MTKKENCKILTEAHNDFSHGLSRYAHSKVHNAALSDDLVQATFMKTWLYLQKTGKIELMRAFLYHVINNLIVDEYRKKKTVSLEVLAEDGFEAKAAVNAESLFNIIDGKALFALIEKLPEKYRAVINLRYVDDLSLKEISAITRKSQNAISVQLHRGLIKLKFLYSLSPDDLQSVVRF
jgi:RNA polymerase sigma-70 factor (ECF subfamily)